MPEKMTLKRVTQDKREGKAPSTQAGEFVREEIEHIRQGKHGARSTQQAIAIGLSKARRAGIELPPPSKGPAALRKRAQRDYDIGHGARVNTRSVETSCRHTYTLSRDNRLDSGFLF